MTTLPAFLAARYDEQEAAAGRGLDGFTDAGWHTVECGVHLGYWAETDCTCRFAAYVLADLAAKRRIVELHESWPVMVETRPEFTSTPDGDSIAMRMSQQIAWLTAQEYRARFGDEPPTSPILRALALPFADHPDYREEWAL